MEALSGLFGRAFPALILVEGFLADEVEQGNADDAGQGDADVV